jgi:hypothetical protein
MNLQDLFVDSGTEVKKEVAAIEYVKPLIKKTTVVNAYHIPEHILYQVQAMESGVPQRVSVVGTRVLAHSVFR